MKKLQNILLLLLAILFLTAESNAEDRRFRWYIPQWTGVSFDGENGQPRFMGEVWGNPTVTWDRMGRTLFLTILKRRAITGLPCEFKTIILLSNKFSRQKRNSRI